MSLSIAITSFERYEMTINSFSQVLDYDYVNDIIVLDDASRDGSYEKLRDYFKDEEKVRVIQQLNNRNMSMNKRDAICLARNKWVAVWDSDNTFDKSYLDSLQYLTTHAWREDVILIPEWAKPTFDYRAYSGSYLDKYSAKTYMQDPMFRCLLNTANYVVPRDAYLNVYQHDPSVKGADTIFFNHLWLKAGNSFFVVPNCRYEHLQHPGSGFLKDVYHNMNQAKEIEQKIMEL